MKSVRDLLFQNVFADHTTERTTYSFFSHKHVYRYCRRIKSRFVSQTTYINVCQSYSDEILMWLNIKNHDDSPVVLTF